MILRQMAAGWWEALATLPLGQQQGWDKVKLSEERTPQALAAPPRCSEMLLENPPGITPRLLPPSACIHSLIHGSVSRFLSQPVTLLETMHLMFKPWNGLWPSPLLSVVGMTFQQGTCLCRGLAGKIWLCKGFGPRWPEGKEQEFFILRRGFRFYFYGSKVTCMHKVLWVLSTCSPFSVHGYSSYQTW